MAYCDPIALPNGEVTYSDAHVEGRYTEGTLAVFSCNNGYDISGDVVASCVMGVTESQGLWDELPTCIQSNQSFSTFYTHAFRGILLKFNFE